MASRFLKRVTLLTAFERLGDRLFGDEWHGFEFQCGEGAPPPSPQDHGEVLNILTGEQARLAKSLKATQEARAICADEQVRAMFDPILKALSEAHSVIVGELREREDDKQVKERHETYKRYEAAWSLLTKALAEGRLEAEADSSTGIDRNLWSDATRGKMNLRLSTVVQPEVLSARVVTIFKDDFERWLAAIPTASGAEFDVIAWCREKIAKRRSEGRPPASQDALFEELRVEQPSLSRRQFDLAWNHEAPKGWKKPGRKASKR